MPNPSLRCLAFALAAVVAVPAFAGDAPAQPQMSAEDAAMMQAWQAAATPGPAHQALAALAGNWKATTTMWMAPGAPPAVSQGKVKRTALLGGRVLQDEFESEVMGQPFTGIGLTGYDNVTGKVWSTWTDTMSTGVMVSYGTRDAATGVTTMQGEMSDPMTKGPHAVRMTSKAEGPDKEVFTMYDTKDGKEFKSMEIIYERVK